MDTVQKRLGEKVRQLRLARGWTQEQLASRANRHWTYIGGIERGERNVTIQVVTDIALALGVPTSELFVPPKEAETRENLRHPWEQVLGAPIDDVLEAIAHGFRAQVDIKGKLAELYLYRILARYEQQGSIANLRWNDKDGEPDFEMTFQTASIRIECKNVRSNQQYKKGQFKGWSKVEVQKTRRGIDPTTGANTRGYSGAEFDVLAACLYNRTKQWDFLLSVTQNLQRRSDEANLLAVMQPVPLKATANWTNDLLAVLQRVVQRP